MIDWLAKLDRRWIFLLMALSVAIPILFELKFPESPTSQAQAVFDEIESLEPGSKVLMAWDYDPASEGELGPMATMFIKHCCEKKLKMYFVSLWPVGPQMVDEGIEKVIKAEFPDLEYGVDYVNLGFKSGYEGVIKVIVTDLRELYTTDVNGTNIDQIPMCRDFKSVQDTDLIINVSAGYAGIKEWAQYAVTPYPDKIKLVGGVTGVNAPLMYPYIPQQIRGLLGAIKGAAEYEDLVVNAYVGDKPPERYTVALKRMGPQLIAHILMMVLIVVGNIVYLTQRSRAAVNN